MYIRGQRLLKHRSGPSQLRIGKCKNVKSLNYQEKWAILPLECWLWTRIHDLSSFLVHLPFGLCLRTDKNEFHALVPRLRRRENDLTLLTLGTRKYAVGLLFGDFYILVHLSTQWVEYYLPPTPMDYSHLISVSPQLPGFTRFVVSRSICQNWSGHVGSMIPLVAATIAKTNATSNFAVAASTLFEKLANRLQLDDPHFNVQSMAELQGVNTTDFVNAMLNAADAFVLQTGQNL